MINCISHNKGKSILLFNNLNNSFEKYLTITLNYKKK